MKDEDLIRQSIDGNPIAFARLVGRYYDAIRSYVASILKDEGKAEEIAQDTFLRAYYHLDELKSPNSLLPWLMRIAHNLAMDHLRREDKVSHISLDDVEEGELTVQSSEEEVLRREMVEEVLKAMEKLPEGEREILIDHLLGDKGYGELGEKYGLSYHAVVMRIRRAKEKVREKVLKRLSGMVMAPWRKIIGLIGGVTVRLTTKVAITGAVLMMLVGAGMWMTRRGENMRMEKQVSASTSEELSVSRPSRSTSALRPGRSEDDKDISGIDEIFEELNTILEESHEDNPQRITKVVRRNDSKDSSIELPGEREFLTLVKEGIAYHDGLVYSGTADITVEEYLSPELNSSGDPNMISPAHSVKKASFYFSGEKLYFTLLWDGVWEDGKSRRRKIEFAYDGETVEERRGDNITIWEDISLSLYDPFIDPRYWGWSIGGREKLSEAIDTFDIESVSKEGNIFVLKGILGGLNAELRIDASKGYRPVRLEFEGGDGRFRICRNYSLKEYASDIWFPESAIETIYLIDPDTQTRQVVGRRSVRIDNVHLNLPLPDSLFRVEWEKAKRVYDERDSTTYEIGSE
jgi:RNA polymerase sigma-70 factor (ECF subfamily)